MSLTCNDSVITYFKHRRISICPLRTTKNLAIPHFPPPINSKVPTFLPFSIPRRVNVPRRPLSIIKRDRGINRRIKTSQPRFQPAFSCFPKRLETSHMGQRETDPLQRRFPHPSLLQIVYPSRGGPSTRRILYYRLEYLTRRETPRHRGIGKEVSSPSPPLPWRRCTTLILFASIFPDRERTNFLSSSLFFWARNLRRYGLLSAPSYALHQPRELLNHGGW